jgi:hypothetical protein
MFTGLDSENIPSVKLWDFSKTNSGTSSVGLTNDCAPVQYFATGGNFASIVVLLPSGCVDGKTIKIVNSNWTSQRQNILLYASDNGGTGNSVVIYNLGANQTLDLCYLKSAYNTNGTASFSTNWVSLNQGSGFSSGIYATNFGFSNNADGGYGFVGGGYSNIASGTACSVIAGNGNTAQASNSFVGGGSSNNATANNSFVGGGTSNTAGDSSSAVVGGANNTTNSSNSGVFVGRYGTTRSIIGNTVLPASNVPIASAAGVTQSALLVLGVATTDATATRLRSNTSAATTTNQVILPNNSAYVFQGTCIANVTGGSTTSGWEFQGVIKRGANAASTTLVAAVTPTVIAQDALATTWVLAITADTTNGGIAVTVTGAAATTIRWVSRIETTEVTF